MTGFTDFLMVLGLVAAWHLYSLANGKTMWRVIRELDPDAKLKSAPAEEFIGRKPPRSDGWTSSPWG